MGVERLSIISLESAFLDWDVLAVIIFLMDIVVVIIVEIIIIILIIMTIRGSEEMGVERLYYFTEAPQLGVA